LDAMGLQFLLRGMGTPLERKKGIIGSGSRSRGRGISRRACGKRFNPGRRHHRVCWTVQAEEKANTPKAEKRPKGDERGPGPFSRSKKTPQGELCREKTRSACQMPDGSEFQKK